MGARAATLPTRVVVDPITGLKREIIEVPPAPKAPPPPPPAKEPR